MPTIGPTAAWLDSYGQGLKRGLQTASADGFRVVQAGAGGELNPEQFSRSATRHLSRYLTDLGLELDALAAEFPGLGLADPQFADQRVAHFRRTLELCAELGAPTAATRVGGWAGETSRPLADEMLAEAAELAERYGMRIALQTGGEEAPLLAERLCALGCPQLHVALDSGTWDPAAAEDPHRRVERVGLVHLRDVRRVGDQVEEVAFGQGRVDFPALLGYLAESGYSGTLTVRRDAPGAGIDALRQGRDYVEALLRGSARR